MGINGGGYTFIPPNVIPKLSSEDITYLLNGKKNADDVIMRLSKPDGSQPYTVVKQLANTGGISVDISKSSIVNNHLGKHLFVGVFENLGKNIRPGMIVNGNELSYDIESYDKCGHMISGYFAFIPNEKEIRPSDLLIHASFYEEDGLAVNWRAKAVRPYSTRRLPLEYFMLTEIHFVCGTYTSSDRWLNSKHPALGAAIGLR